MLSIGYAGLGTLWLWTMPAWSRIDGDEAFNLAKARLVSAGHTLYGDVWSDQPPLFTWMLAAWERLLGIGLYDDATAGRVLVLWLSSVVVFVAADLARRAAGETPRRVAAACVAAVVLVLGSKAFLQLAGSIMIGLPALSLATLSLYLAFLATRARWQTGWSAVAGVVLGLAFLVKMNVFIVVPALVVLFVWSEPPMAARVALCDRTRGDAGGRRPRDAGRRFCRSTASPACRGADGRRCGLGRPGHRRSPARPTCRRRFGTMPRRSGARSAATCR